MNKEENENMKFKVSIPLLTQEEINGIDININEMINKFTQILVKEKDLAIAQHIIKRQQERIEQLEQKEAIVDKVTEKLKEDIKTFGNHEERKQMCKEQLYENDGKWFHAKKILNIIEGEKNERI